MNISLSYRLLLCLAIATSMTITGCGALAQFMYIVKGHDIPAEYSAFENSRVAVVVLTDSSSYGPDPLSDKIEHYIATKLLGNIDDVEIVSKREIDNWTDINGWNETNMDELGKGVNADFVLSVNVEDYKIREGSTIYKGRSEVTVNVFDVAKNTVSFTSGPDYMEYPENGRPAIQTNDRKFEAFYLAWLTERIARRFYKYESLIDVADEASFSG